MKAHTPIHKSVLLLIWSVILTGGTLVFGAAPLKPVRMNIGAAPFWLLGLGLSTLFWALQIPTIGTALLLFTILVGTWAELEQRGYSLVQSVAAGLLATIGIASAALFFITKRNPSYWIGQLTAAIEGVIARVSKVDLALAESLKVEELLLQVPSVIVVALIIAAALVAICERPLLKWSGHGVVRKERLTDLQLPDALVWVLIAAVFGAFWDGSSKTVSAISMNILNILAVCYFFQGMAILCRYFQVFRVGYFWRVIWVSIFALQLFLVLSFVGVIDYWLDFRKKMMKKSSELKKKSISE